jgi:hypothetical protein
MNSRTKCFSRLLHGLALFGILSIIGSYASLADAAQGCGQGRHLNGWGRCVLNYPGPYASPAPFRPGCWYNWAGQLRCYRR